MVSDTALARGGTIVLFFGFIALYWDSNLVIYFAAALIALGNGLMWPSVMSMLSKVAGDQYQGAIQGLTGSVGAVASIAGLIAGGLLYNWLGAWLFVIATAIVLPVSIITLSLRNSVH